MTECLQCKRELADDFVSPSGICNDCMREMTEKGLKARATSTKMMYGIFAVLIVGGIGVLIWLLLSQ